MNAPYAAATLDDLDAIPVAHGLVWRPIRRRFDLRGFGVNAYTAEDVGGQVVEEHTEGRLRHEELYLVVRGRATFTLDGTEVDAPQGTLVHIVDPLVRRVALSQEDGTTVLALGGMPGEPFQVSAWEAMFAAIPAALDERWDEAIALHEEALLEQPGHAGLLYNLACMEARGGRHLDALLHLQQAVALDPQTGGWAQRDSDFAAIRAEPGFPPAPAPRPAEAEDEDQAVRSGGWQVLRLDELARADGVPFAPARIALHGTDVAAHDERTAGLETLYVVLRGRARLAVAREELAAPAGTLVAVAPTVTRAVRLEPGSLVLSVAAAPGVAWEPASDGAVAGQPDAVGEPA